MAETVGELADTAAPLLAMAGLNSSVLKQALGLNNGSFKPSNEQELKNFMSSDEELIAETRGGNRASFQELVEKYQRRMYSVAYGILGNREDALDAVQEAFIKAYRSLPEFKGQSTFYTWLYRITVNAAIDLARKAQRHEEVEFREEIEVVEEKGDYPVAAQSENPSERLMRKELGELIEKAIALLPVEQRTAVVLREIEGLSYREIAGIMKCSEGTVMSRLHYGRKKLQELLEPHLER
ncbi:MAG: sigma-70 family RNA polymerase sigma factor [Candidatus Abyssobacteria bacterium SURF_5]|uniref:Sigma-70 family RNA polymerase sigma factor n=1 Tax=Abyssobacteria bacterium (strain SURF_5) TaxID=2093360 RepID=A0A3A4NH21_ABYX5|nr:MAG: sigma-70 family RNA polymerase sigma factor [Candidatus Abyssubacteria bacterium SURF_5]